MNPALGEDEIPAPSPAPQPAGVVVEDRTHVTEDQKQQMVMDRIYRVVGTPLRPLVPRGVALAGLAHWTGTLARLTLRQPADIEPELVSGYDRVPSAQLAHRVLSDQDTAPVSEAEKKAVVLELALAQLDHPGVKIGSHIWVHTLASWTGQMARLLDRSHQEAMELVRAAWEATPAAAVADFQARNQAARQKG